MMTLLLGKSGCGKTHAVTEEIGALLSGGASVILICPEQEAVIAERRTTARFSGVIPTFGLEILNFGRLPERVFREYGGLTDQLLSEGGRRLLMHRTLADVAPYLREYSRCVEDEAMIDKLLAAIAEFKMFCVPPAVLENAGNTLPAGYRRLSDKLADLSLIYAAYEALLHRAYHDPQDALTALDGVLDEHDGAFFAGKHVYLDGFNGFTAQQYRIIAHMLRRAEQVTVTLGCPADMDGEPDWMLRRIIETRRNLTRMAEGMHITVSISELTENRRSASAALRHLQKNLWTMGSTEPAEPGDDIALFACDNPFDEAEAIALDISRYIRAGGRYRDITVITRGTERYDGILDAALQTYGIPCDTAHRTQVTSKPFFRYLRYLFALAIYHMARADLIGLIKTGCSGMDDADAFLYENYITTWNLTGRRLTAEDAYTMHPRGYIEVFSEEDHRVLDAVNRVRQQILDTYAPFLEDIARPGQTMTDIAAQLYHFLCAQGMPEMLDRRAQREAAFGDLSSADETAQLWDVFVEALDTLVSIAGDMQGGASEFWRLFGMVISDLDIGTIPARADQVMIGDASLIRVDRAKAVYLIGAVDGMFPKTPEEDALLSDHEKSILAGLGIGLSEDSASKLQDELFHFWFAASAAEQRLVVTYPRADLTGKAYRPSSAVERIRVLFPSLIPTNPTHQPPEARMASFASAFEIMAYEKQSPLGRALWDYFTSQADQNPDLRRRLDALSQPLVQRTCRLNAQTLESLFGDTIAMTQSRLESYVLCHFAYFCGYVLKLQEPKRASFGTADIGSFIHDVLRGFMELYTTDENPARFADETVLNETLGALVGGYLETVCGVRWDAQQPTRVRHLFSRLQRSAAVIVRNLMHEFENSDFVPRDFELPVGGDDGRAIPALSIAAGDGTRIRLYGTIDRVDTYERDGVTYVRVVDYKTFVKRFSLDDVAAGINLQMLLYLFAVWKNGGVRYAGELRPAGILYTGASPTEVTCSGIPTKEEVLAAAENSMDRSGLFLDDADVLQAMEHGLGGKYIPVRMKKDGSLYKGAPVESLEAFGQLMRDVEQTVSDIVMEMKRGNADAIPISITNPDTGRDPCSYCGMRFVCRGK
ncbi:MAG: hypothetical protein E7604_01060 [Ruminococcaceae bacterium]|nr:hypothetical protein [Oscillospiraceae bacterium]